MWQVEFDRRAFKELQRLGTADKRRVVRFIDERLAARADPRSLGSALMGNLSGLWRYRVGDIRIIAKLEDQRFVILVVSVGNRGKIYR